MNFIIDEDLYISVRSASRKPGENEAAFTTKADLTKLTADWPTSKLIQTWNGFAGVAPFGELKPVKKFETRGTAIDRIWTAIQRLKQDGSQEEPEPEKPKPVEASSKKPEKAATPEARTAPQNGNGKPKRKTKVDIVVGLMFRQTGCSIRDIMKATGSSYSSSTNHLYQAKRQAEKSGTVKTQRSEDGTQVYFAAAAGR